MTPDQWRALNDDGDDDGARGDRGATAASAASAAGGTGREDACPIRIWSLNH